MRISDGGARRQRGTGFQRQPATPGAPGTPTSRAASPLEIGNPPIGDVVGVSGARYRAVLGDAFIEGDGDGRAIHPNDVGQGALGDCYFMSALAAIAESDPQTIQNNIHDNGDGSYTVALYEKRPRGMRSGPEFTRREIRVTAEFPAKEGRLAFAQGGDALARRKELWVALYEKAFATLWGGYSNIEGGRGHEAMEAITGKKSSSYVPSPSSLDLIDRALRRGDAVTAGTLPRFLALDDSLFDEGTLIASHEYYVVGVDREKGTITFRNPFGWDLGPTTLWIDDFLRSFGRVSINRGG